MHRITRIVVCLLAVSPAYLVAQADPAKSTVGKSEKPSFDPSKPRDLTFDDIKFDINKGDAFKRSMLSEKIEKLHSSQIRIRGYILPSFQQKGITQFVLVRDNMECCFGPGAAIYDCVLVDMAEGKSTSFTVRPVAVRGKFEISEFKGPDGKHLAIYRIVAEEVK